MKENTENLQQSIQEKKRELQSYKVGDTDRHGNKITFIFTRSDSYAVYEIDQKDVVRSIQVSIAESEQDAGMKDSYRKRFGCVRNEFIAAQGVMDKLLANSVSTFKTRLAGLIGMALETQCGSAKMKTIEKEFADMATQVTKEYRYQWNSKLKYTLYSALATILAVAVAGIFFFSGSDFLNNARLYLIPIIMMASIGGFISIQTGIEKTRFPKDFSNTMIALFALERMLVAMLSGLVVVVAIKSGLALAIAGVTEISVYYYMIFAAVAGYCEKFVPNLLLSIGQKGSVKIN